jgi:hypothetical protein
MRQVRRALPGSRHLRLRQRQRAQSGPALAIALVVLLLLEIALRRWQVLLPVPAWLRRRRPLAAPAVEPASSTPVTVVAQREPTAPAAAVDSKAVPASEPADGVLGALSRAQKRGGR